MGPAGAKRLQRLLRPFAHPPDKRAKGGEAVGHVVGGGELRAGHGAAIDLRDPAERTVAKAPSPGRGGVGRIGRVRRSFLVKPPHGGFDPPRRRVRHGVDGGEDGVGVHDLPAIGEFGGEFLLPRQAEHEGAEFVVQRVIGGDRGEGVEPGFGDFGGGVAGQRQRDLKRERATGLPFIERVGIVRHQKGALCWAGPPVDDDRRGEFAEERRGRAFGEVELPCLLPLRQLQHAAIGHLAAIGV